MRAGELRNRITIQAATITHDANGIAVPTWVEIDTVWAKKAHQQSREIFAAQKSNAETTDLFIIRYRNGINTAMQAVSSGKTYDILGADDPDGRRRELWLLCKAVI